MRLTRLAHSVFFALALACTAAAPGCGNKEVTAENIEEQGVLPEQHDTGTVVWSLTPEGQVRALVKGPDGKPIEEGVTGSLKVKTAPGAEPVKVNLEPQKDSGGLLAATLPKLEADLTEVSYELKVGDKPFKGALHVPKGGTPELVAAAKVTADAKLEGKKGPNGGIVQVVGEDTVEVVADKSSGKVRVYLLDDDLKAAPIKDRKLAVKLALTGAGTESVELAADPKGLYFEGKLKVKVNPTKITIVLVDNGVTHVALCGWHPGKVIIVGPSAPVLVLFVAVKWDIDVVVKPPIVIHHDDDDDDGKVIVIGKKGKGWKGKWKGKWK